MKKAKIIVLILTTVMALSLMTGCETQKKVESNNSSATASTTVGQTASPTADVNKDNINITMTLVKKDGSSKDYPIKTKKDHSLRQALFDAGLITEAELSAPFIQVIDGQKVDVTNNGTMWLPCDADGKNLKKAMEDIIVTDGTKYKIVFTVVPNMD